MQYTAAFDIGTTAIKGLLADDQQQILFQSSIAITTQISGDFKEQNPDDWYHGFCAISQQMLQCVAAENIRGIIMSGQMQDLILLDAQLSPLGPAILYSDSRATTQADTIRQLVGDRQLTTIIGNQMNGSLPVAKLLWVREHQPALFAKIHTVLVSSKDYCLAKLCHVAATDIVSASTFGMMEITTKHWSREIAELLDIDLALLPTLHVCQQQVGCVTTVAAQQTG